MDTPAGRDAGVRGLAPISMALLLALAAAAAWFVAHKLHYFVETSRGSLDPYFWPRRWALWPHLGGGAVAMTTGLVQLWLGLGGRTAALHRALGRIYVAAIAVAAPAGAYLALTVPGHLPYKAGLISLALAWTLTTSMAVLAIRQRHIAQHRAWMMRSYAVTFAFVTFRLFYDWIAPHVAMAPDPVADDVATIMAWACWALPLLVLEPFIQFGAFVRAPSAGVVRPAPSSPPSAMPGSMIGSG